MPEQTIQSVLAAFRSGQDSSRQLTVRCLATIADPAGEGCRTFLHVDAERAMQQAAAADRAYAAGTPAGPLAGIPISVKDLFDIAGEVTTAGSRVLASAPPATQDAAAVGRLRAAGAVLIGRTNMTEFAYSGVGLNPHFGTPKNPWDRAAARIPGGSSSGAAVSVADGMALAALGTDTGGSVRIPAALCGLTGWKPTAIRIPMHGVVPLAPSLDSIGPLANSVGCCARMDAVLAGEPYTPIPRVELSSLRFGVLQGYVLDALDDAVALGFDRTLNRLSSCGARLQPLHFPALARIPASNQSAATEAYAWHRALLEQHGSAYDPHVSARILHGAGVLAADYLDLQRIRREIAAEAERAFQGVDAILLPTTPRMAPAIVSLQASDAAYFDANGAMLRNTSIFNFLDGCALSVPCHREGEPPVGLMIAGLGGWDGRVLRAGAAIEAALMPIRDGGSAG